VKDNNEPACGEPARSRSMPTKQSERIVSPYSVVLAHQISEPVSTESAQRATLPRVVDGAIQLPAKKTVISQSSDSDTSEDGTLTPKNMNKTLSVEYAELELENPSETVTSQSCASFASNKTSSPSATETDYKEIDWLKTNALINTKKQLETKRKY
jgi:hypothetical protein